MSKPKRPRITIDIHEPEALYDALKPLCEKKNVGLARKHLDVGDFEILDMNGKKWGIERKAAMDLYGSIVKKTSDGKTGRVYDQLARLTDKYGDRAMLLLESPKYLHRTGVPKYRMLQIIYTFFSERSLLMPTLLTRDRGHTAYLMVKLAGELHDIKFSGRGITVSRTEK